MTMRTYIKQTQNHRTAALLIALLFLLSLFLGAAFVLAEQHHHCTGAHCEICAAVAHTVAYLKAGTTSVTLAVVIALWLFLATHTVLRATQGYRVSPSLVSLKVKLSD